MVNVLARLHSSFLDDEELYEDLDAVLGAPAGPTNLARRARPSPRLSLWRRLRSGRRLVEPVEPAPSRHQVDHMKRILDQLVQIAAYRVRVDSNRELADAISHADCLMRAMKADTEEAFTLVYLRRTALAAMELLSADETPTLSMPTQMPPTCPVPTATCGSDSSWPEGSCAASGTALSSLVAPVLADETTPRCS